MNTILAYLKQLELSDSEAKMYLTLLQTGPITVRELASTTDIKRTTAYLYIDQLIEKGLVIKLVKGSQKLIAANSPDSLEHLVKEQVVSAEVAKKQFKEVISLITSKMPEEKELEETEIRYFKGVSGIMKVYEDAVSGSELRMYVNLAELDRHISARTIDLDYDYFEKGIAANPALEIYEIFADMPGTIDQYNLEDTAKKGRYHYKYMPQKVGLTAPGILLFDNKVAIISGKENLHVFVLYNQEYYDNSKKLFDFIWDELPEEKKENSK